MLYRVINLPNDVKEGEGVGGVLKNFLFTMDIECIDNTDYL